MTAANSTDFPTLKSGVGRGGEVGRTRGPTTPPTSPPPVRGVWGGEVGWGPVGRVSRWGNSEVGR